MKIKLEVKKRILIVRLFGELDHHGADEVRAKIEAAIRDRGTVNVIFDMSGLEFMDSSGIGLIVGRYKLVTPMGGRIYVSCPGNGIGRILKMSGTDKLVTIFKSTEEAIKAAL